MWLKLLQKDLQGTSIGTAIGRQNITDIFKKSGVFTIRKEEPCL
jgi:hypothetical protein